MLFNWMSGTMQPPISGNALLDVFTNLMTAGVLEQIADVLAPLQSTFHPNLMYRWAHSVTPPLTPLCTPRRRIIDPIAIWPHVFGSTNSFNRPADCGTPPTPPTSRIHPYTAPANRSKRPSRLVGAIEADDGCMQDLMMMAATSAIPSTPTTPTTTTMITTPMRRRPTKLHAIKRQLMASSTVDDLMQAMRRIVDAEASSRCSTTSTTTPMATSPMTVAIAVASRKRRLVDASPLSLSRLRIDTSRVGPKKEWLLADMLDLSDVTVFDVLHREQETAATAQDETLDMTRSIFDDTMNPVDGNNNDVCACCEMQNMWQVDFIDEYYIL